MKHGISAPGQEEPHAGSAPTIRIEYALSLALVASDDTPRGEASPEVVVEFEELVGDSRSDHDVLRGGGDGRGEVLARRSRASCAVAPAVTLPPRADLHDVFFVNVPLTNLGHLATRLSTAKRLDLLSSDDWPWSVCITDLQVIAEILDGPGEFLAYLSARRTSNDAGGAVTPDENDFLMEATKSFGTPTHDFSSA